MNPMRVGRQQYGTPKKKVFCCRVCHISMGSKGLRNQHELENHPNRRPFSCTQCEKGFFTKSHLVSHGKVHSTAKVLRCFQCCFTTKWQSSLERHRALENHHINKWQARKRQPVEPFQCQQCNARTFVRVPNYNLTIMNVRGQDGSIRRIRFNPPTKQSREWLRQQRATALKQERAIKSIQDFNVGDIDYQLY